MESDVSSTDVAPLPARALWTGPRHDPTRYRVDLAEGTLQSVGDGGEGLVYHATCDVDGAEREVALKMHTAARADDYSRLVTRAQILSGIDHPNVMHLLDAFVGSALVESPSSDDEDFNVIYTVADWIPGVSFHQALETAGPAAGLQWVGQIARATAFLHDYRSDQSPAGIIHRDIKPSNVRITVDQTAVLIDFGIARPHEEGDLTEGAGTYLWRAPEVLGGPGNPGPASDAWGIGALAYWVLIGEPPRLEGAEAAREPLTRAAEQARLSDPANIGRHIAQLLESHPDQRPHDLAHWADDLDGLLAGSRRGPKWKRPKVLVPGLAGLCVVALVVALILTGTVNSPTRTVALRSGGSYQLPRWNYSDGVTVSQIWTFLRSPHEDLEGSVTVTNKRASQVVHTYDEVIPRGLASSLADVSFSPAPDSTVNRDPVVRYCLDLAPRAQRVLTYDVPMSAAPTTQVYKSWAKSWKTETTDDLMHFSGARCPGAPKAQPKATINSSGAGAISTPGKGSALPSSKGDYVAGGSRPGSSTSIVSGGKAPGLGPSGGGSSGPPGGGSSGPPSGGSPPPTHTSTWSTPVQFNGTSGNEVVSCASSTYCAAVNGTDSIFTWNGSWSDNLALQSEQLDSVSCTSSRFCVAVGGQGALDIYMSNGTGWTNDSQAGSGSLNSVSCTSPTFCMAVGYQTPSSSNGGDLALLYNGTTWSVVPTPSVPNIPASTFSTLLNVSCSSPSSCAAVGYWDEGPSTVSHSEDYNGEVWTIVQEPMPAGGKDIPPFTGVSCPTTTFCLAVGYELVFANGTGIASNGGISKSYNGSVWSEVQVPNSVPLSGVSCMNSGGCMVGTYATGDILTYRNGIWSQIQNVDGSNTISSISCPTSGFCMAVDTAGNYLTYS